MAKYRFQWENLPADLLDSLAQSLHLVPPPAASLRAAYGARPKAAFVADAWPFLLRDWLPGQTEVRQAIVENLRARRLGAWDETYDGPARQLQYLTSCRNSSALRDTVLTQLILAGEVSTLRLPDSKPAPDTSPPPRLDSTPESHGELKSLSDFVDETLLAGLELTHLKKDDDGDIPIRVGSSQCYVRVVDGADTPSRVDFMCPLVYKVTKSPELLDSLNEINRQLTIGRAFFVDDQVILMASILADSLSPSELLWTLDVVTDAADYFDTKLKARYGGEITYDDLDASAVNV